MIFTSIVLVVLATAYAVTAVIDREMKRQMKRNKELGVIMHHAVNYAIWIEVDGKAQRLAWLDSQKERWADICADDRPVLDALEGVYADDFRGWYMIADAAHKSPEQTHKELQASWFASALEQLKGRHQ